MQSLLSKIKYRSHKDVVILIVCLATYKAESPFYLTYFFLKKT